MRLEPIYIQGIETNNLKNITVLLKKNAINLVVGPSGSGKSSLAYDTVAQIGLYEFNSMFSDTPFESNFRVRSYSNMITTVPIRQSNANNNIRSTIGTYFNLNSHVAMIYSVLLNLPYDFFILNKEGNVCQTCHGIGYKKELDLNRLIDYDVSLEKCPIKCWTRYKDFYIGIIKEFCADIGIDCKKKFQQLNQEEKRLFLYAESNKKYSIRFKKNNAYSRRTTKYFGVMTGNPMFPKFTPGSAYYTDTVCPECNGQKYSSEHSEIKLQGLSIGELMCIPFSDIRVWLDSVRNASKDLSLKFSIQRIADFATAADSLNLGYLSLNRTIPSLSGGEFQRIKLVQVFNTQLTNLLIVLDEPLAGLSFDEKKIVHQKIKKLSEKHTMLIIDHHNIFYGDASNIIALGEGSGKYGGSIINSDKYIQSQSVSFDFEPQPIRNILQIKLQNPVYKYSGISIDIADSCLNLITGHSGVGKSTLLREYFPQYFEKYAYINQKPLVGNSNSSVATALDIFSNISELFAKKFNKDKLFFSNHTGSEGACPFCLGAGKVFYGNDFQDTTQIECKECDGTGFNQKLKSFKIDGMSILNVWKMTIDEAFSSLVCNNKVLTSLSNAIKILLGHLVIGQPTSTLSGGENIRIKILKSLKTTSHVYGIDEPFRGLNNAEIYKLVIFFDNLLKKGKTIIVADHEEESFKYFSSHIVLSNTNGVLTGRSFF
ncbi:ATP-binding cassette domain-containing protein [Desulfovibrio litoralis]|uniref:UvrABC system protein A n=1 Tax=Desulfovibrio litoralis DSM 11393 TaxID=1121455 RepID=A0A1M7TLS1_9BACT|nr:ATP-binding cassette domain-containing protein [Desulfovibrio litoralis]SHN71682.1 ABC transporter [Desulfovibrio litoralis DSM 11393]